MMDRQSSSVFKVRLRIWSIILLRMGNVVLASHSSSQGCDAREIPSGAATETEFSLPQKWRAENTSQQLLWKLVA